MRFEEDIFKAEKVLVHAHHAQQTMHAKTLTQTAVAVVNHKVGSECPGCEVVHAAGAVRHVAHHDGVGLREPAQETLISEVTSTTQREVHVSSQWQSIHVTRWVPRDGGVVLNRINPTVCSAHERSI